MTNDSGAWVEKYAYTLYGKPAAASTIGNPYMYTGRRLDAETGLYYYRARYYDPHLRRFIETDPIGYAAGMNLYAYVGNSSVNFVDPYGLYGFDDFLFEMANVSAGFGDTITGRDTARIRQMWYDAFNWEDPINECSFSYKAGIVYAFGWDVVFSAATMNAGGTVKAARSASIIKTATPITKNSVIRGYKVSNHAWRKSGIGRGATEEFVGKVIDSARKTGNVIKETSSHPRYSCNTISQYTHDGVTVVVDEIRRVIISIKPTASSQFKF